MTHKWAAFEINSISITDPKASQILEAKTIKMFQVGLNGINDKLL